MKTGINVSDAMTKKPVFIGPDKSIIDCAKKMKKHDLGSVIVRDKSEFVGFVTENDFVKLLSKNADLSEVKIKDIMTPRKNVVSVEQDADLYDALRIMQDNNFKRLPVMNKKDELVGILTVKDVLKIQPQLFDLLVEKYELRDEDEKIFFSNDGKNGACDVCGVKGNVFNVRGKLLCRACRDSM